VVGGHIHKAPQEKPDVKNQRTCFFKIIEGWKFNSVQVYVNCFQTIEKTNNKGTYRNFIFFIFLTVGALRIWAQAYRYYAKRLQGPIGTRLYRLWYHTDRD